MRYKIIAFLFLLILSSFSNAATEVKTGFKKRKPFVPLVVILKNELKAHHSPVFEPLLKTWEARFGIKATMPLLSIAQNKKNKDFERFIALMGAIKLGGSATAPHLVPFFKDTSWMLRSGALRCLKVTQNRKIAVMAIPLLKDPALVVRSEAIDTLAALRPEGTVKALLDTLVDQTNYSKGKPLFVPKKALAALVKLKDKKAIPYIQLFLKRHPALQAQK
jgi:hypothetical protein